jgi:hypothetical protein
MSAANREEEGTFGWEKELRYIGWEEEGGAPRSKDS